MIEIDGSYGEGGGQILRTSISLSALTLKPVRITGIRAGRKKPGLRRQHLAGIELTSWLVGAKVKGLEVGSTEVEFHPKERKGGVFSYDVGTAGSISLVLQAVLPPAILSPEPLTFKIKGGTDVSWSPPLDYLREVFTPMLQKMGTKVEIIQELRGHYPKGGGQVSVSVIPVDGIDAMDFSEFGDIVGVSGISHCVRLPGHVADRQAVSAEEVIQNNGIKVDEIKRESYPKGNDPHLGPGSGIVLWAESNTGIRIGSTNLGARGKRAEIVGEEAAEKLVIELNTGKAIDSHLCD
ncbi:MAG: RNA 3'-terminal phosphate cyclase, partial [Candidatus Thorarchaeota archaeon]|nr:RNA 3'-terminal phosphate cyclase [Candidatus Thorarchaeota archaeon]